MVLQSKIEEFICRCNELDDDMKMFLLSGKFENELAYTWFREHKFDDVTVEKLEQMIMDTSCKRLMSTRAYRDWSRRCDMAEFFTDGEVEHFMLLNCRLVELMHQVFCQVARMHRHLQAEIASGNHDYDTFVIEGEVCMEPLALEDDESRCDELQERLIDAVKNYGVIMVSCNQSQEELDEVACRYLNWWANWGSNFKELVTRHGIPICRAFKHFLDESCVFTVEDILKIKPEQFQTSIKIYI